MALPQMGIFALGTRSHYYLELDLRPDAQTSALFDVVGALREPRMTTGGANLVVAFGAKAWVAAGGDVPSDLGPFVAVTGPDGFTMPSTQHDVWVWASGTGYDVVFDVARAVATAFAPIATVATEHHGFTYRDSRDLTGFVDGTENPPLDEAPFVASVRDGEPGAGGSVVLFQRWVHDLGAFHELDEPQQEGVVGRTKPDSVELEDETKPTTAHIARVVIEDDGEELEIFRRSTSYGGVAEHGLLFVAFSADVRRLRLMLDRITGRSDGVRDRLTEFTTPQTGAFYFAPSLEALAKATG
ncbi:MAG: Dyp-type peroxidase [Acidimicrobiales bacterium]